MKEQFAEDMEAQGNVLKLQLLAVRQVVQSAPLKKALGASWCCRDGVLLSLLLLLLALLSLLLLL